MASGKKVCKKCRVFIEGGDACPICNGTQFTETWKGRVFIFKPEESEIGKKMGIHKKGFYAIKTK
jgi:RNA polymerase subunit RPABC4/transcription elongation factor Spt4